MASVYQDKDLNKDQGAGTELAAASTGTSASVEPGAMLSNASNAKNYTQQINNIANSSTLKYTPGSSVTAAQSYLDSVISNKPGSYSGKYTSQVENLYNRIMNREKFSYDLNGDAMYQNYAQRYKQMGLQSMRDTMGQAAATTGGYGNSYAQTAGQSAYNSYISSLAEQVPQLQAQALERYNTETQNLQNLYSTATTADNTDYSRWNDSMSRWQSERDYAANAYDAAYNRDYTAHANNIANASNVVAMQRQDEQNAITNAQSQVQTMLNAGIMPGADLIAASGWDAENIRQLLKKIK